MGSQSLGDLGSRWTAPWAHSPIDVFVMLPLSMVRLLAVDADGVFRAAPWFGTALSVLAASGVRGVAVDVWVRAAAALPHQLNVSDQNSLIDRCSGDLSSASLSAIVRTLCVCKPSTSCELIRTAAHPPSQVVMSFHACGGNVGDTAQIPLPAWVLQCGEHDPDLFFTDRPREGAGRRNREYLSIWADEAAALRGRTPLQCYEDFMQAFCNNFHQVSRAAQQAEPSCSQVRFIPSLQAMGHPGSPAALQQAPLVVPPQAAPLEPRAAVWQGLEASTPLWHAAAATGAWQQCRQAHSAPTGAWLLMPLAPPPAPHPRAWLAGVASAALPL
ncbi:beta-amylase [Haematococcus lacustris]|uniref:Beta-amylase n=1 Tax=Haematococcus lacustris TaxID=44745 RepID=A0A699ZFV6_HAELA|nr:beta-amylase [Haematococcus lacustris]